MSMKVNICGKNTINMPTSGCSDCAELEYRIKKLEDFAAETQEWIEHIETDGYDALTNKPTINGVTVEGDKTSEEYLILPISDDELEALTPMDCYVPPREKPIVCVGEVCSAVLECDPTIGRTCEGETCQATVLCVEEEEPTEIEPVESEELVIDDEPSPSV